MAILAQVPIVRETRNHRLVVQNPHPQLVNHHDPRYLANALRPVLCERVRRVHVELLGPRRAVDDLVACAGVPRQTERPLVGLLECSARMQRGILVQVLLDEALLTVCRHGLIQHRRVEEDLAEAGPRQHAPLAVGREDGPQGDFTEAAVTLHDVGEGARSRASGRTGGRRGESGGRGGGWSGVRWDAVLEAPGGMWLAAVGVEELETSVADAPHASELLFLLKFFLAVSFGLALDGLGELRLVACGVPVQVGHLWSVSRAYKYVFDFLPQNLELEGRTQNLQN